MTTYELYDLPGTRPVLRPASGIRRLLDLIARHRLRRRTLQLLARLDAEQLGDIGIDPELVADALDGDAGPLWSSIEDRRRVA